MQFCISSSFPGCRRLLDQRSNQRVSSDQELARPDLQDRPELDFRSKRGKPRGRNHKVGGQNVGRHFVQADSAQSETIHQNSLDRKGSAERATHC